MLQYKDDIREILMFSLQGLSRKDNEINNDTDLTLYGLDSIVAVSLIVTLENKYNIEVEHYDLTIDNVISIKKINSLLEKYLNENEI